MNINDLFAERYNFHEYEGDRIFLCKCCDRRFRGADDLKVHFRKSIFIVLSSQNLLILKYIAVWTEALSWATAANKWFLLFLTSDGFFNLISEIIVQLGWWALHQIDITSLKTGDWLCVQKKNPWLWFKAAVECVRVWYNLIPLVYLLNHSWGRTPKIGKKLQSNDSAVIKY